MSKKIAVWLALATAAFLVQVPTATQVAGAYAPAEGAVFNVPAPWGTAEQQNRIINKVNTAVEHAAPGSTVLIATYLFDRKKSVDALIAACQKGASVRVLLDGNIATSASARLAQTLNGDNVDDDGPNTGACGQGAPVPGETPTPLTQEDVPESVTEVDGSRPSWGGDRSYVAKCNRACRGDGSSMHGKFYVFSQTGEASNVIMVSSSNLNAGGASRGWNDLYTH